MELERVGVKLERSNRFRWAALDFGRVTLYSGRMSLYFGGGTLDSARTSLNFDGALLDFGSASLDFGRVTLYFDSTQLDFQSRRPTSAPAAQLPLPSLDFNTCCFNSRAEFPFHSNVISYSIRFAVLRAVSGPSSLLTIWKAMLMPAEMPPEVMMFPSSTYLTLRCT